MPTYQFEGLTPVVEPGAFVHPTATLIGDVVIEQGCFVGPSAVVRGDLGRIVIQKGSNLQDCCVIHSFPKRETVLEPDSHIGHGAILHGCTIRRNAMIGIHAVVMDGAVIGEEAIVAALAFVKGETHIPPRTLAVGIPAKVVRELRPEDIAQKIVGTRHYQHLACRYLATLREVAPLPAVEPNRPRLPVPDIGPA